MKKMKLTALIMAIVCVACAFAGCASVKWDDMKNKDVVAVVNGTEVTKQHIMYYYAEDCASAQVSANLFAQMGLDEEMDEEEGIETSFYSAMAYYIVGEVARENGFGITEDEAYEKAYEEYVLIGKKPGYDYITEYNNQIKEMLYFDDEKMVEYASAKLYNSVAATKYVESLLEEMQYDYPEDPDTKDASLKEAVTQKLIEECGKVDVQLNYHSKKAMEKVDYAEIVNRAATTFIRTQAEE